jgi:ABC-type glycerol-3-phosphate transport system substrate-binding protein
VRIELELSVQANNAALIQPFLNEFEARQGIHVRLHVSDWTTAWSEVTRTALNRAGPDVSEVGSTWLGDLNATGALRPFAQNEVSQIRKQGDFLPVAWAAAKLPHRSSMCAIPWMVNARLMFYRRRWFERCKIDPATAFNTPAQLEQTLACLQAAGASAPWLTTTLPRRSMVQNTCMWVWANGGEPLASDGQRVLFDQPPALAGYSQYFALGRYLAPQFQYLDGSQLCRQFIARPETAVMLIGPWSFEEIPLEPRDEFGLALPLSLLPAQLEALSLPPYSDDPWWQIAAQAVQAGHAPSTTLSWSIMEERLRFELAAIWQDVLNDPHADLYPLVAQRLGHLAQQINAVLTLPAMQRSVPAASTGYGIDR